MRTAMLEMRKISYPLLVCAALLLLTSCHDFRHLSYRGKMMIKTKKNLMRGLDFDLSKQQVKETESESAEVESTDYLRYHIITDSLAAGESLDMEYFFNKKDQLDLMIAFYNISDSNAIHPMADEIVHYMEHEHGKPKVDEQGWYHWEIEDNTGEPGTIEINLVGETEAGYMGVELEMIKYYSYEERLDKNR